MSSRDKILSKLRAARKPFTDVETITERRHMVELEDISPPALQARFVKEAETLGCKVYCVSKGEAIEIVKQLVGEDRLVLSWQPQHIPLSGLHQRLDDDGVAIAKHDDGKVRVGITGVDAALAATGSLVVSSGAGKYRTTSLLPDVHIAVMTADQIVPDMETWVKQVQPEDFTTPSNIVLISGPSKTADIAQELIKGAHGPREVHIILLQ